MFRQKLVEKKQELEIELIKMKVNEADLKEIDEEVEQYRQKLIADLEAEYQRERIIVGAQIDILEDLLEEVKE